MGKHFFDFDDGDFVHPISDNIAIDDEGNLMMKIGNNMAIDMDSGEMHIVSEWPADEDNNQDNDSR